MTAWASTFLCSSRECQAINPHCAWLQFQLSRCWAVLWITLKSWKEPCVVKTLRQKDRQSAQGEIVWDERKHILLAERYSSIRGENSVIRNPSHMNETSPLSFQHLSFPLFLSLLCFGSILVRSLLNLAVEKRGYRESCWACVHGWRRCEMTVTKEDAH